LQRKVTYLWKEPGAPKPYRTAVSLHGHTNLSREGLYFIPEFAARYGPLRAALAFQDRRAQTISAIRLDFWKAYWTPPLPPLAAFRLEREQIEQKLGLSSLISLTDHDSIAAPLLLRVVPEARPIPVSMEWSVPFRDTILHLGMHNLPSAQAESIMARCAAFTAHPAEEDLPDLLARLHDNPDILIVLNHPLWDLAGIGRPRHAHTVGGFLADLGMYIHALELSGLRSWEENQAVLQLAEGWNQLVIAGGDRHGCEPSAALNLTNAESFTEFVHEIRRDRRSQVLFMPQYAEPYKMRMAQSLLDVVRYYPDFPEGSRRWDERTFHPDASGVIRPLAALWEKSPFFIEAVFAGVRLMEVSPVKRAMQRAFARPEQELQFTLREGQEFAP
jgi:hypothetical protein